MIADLRFALRQLAKNSGFTAVAVTAQFVSGNYHNGLGAAVALDPRGLAG